MSTIESEMKRKQVGGCKGLLLWWMDETKEKERQVKNKTKRYLKRRRDEKYRDS